MRSTFNILFYVNKSKEKGGTTRLSVSGGYHGMVPVMGRVTINGTQSQFSCKKTIPLDMWDVKGNKTLPPTSVQTEDWLMALSGSDACG